MLEVRPQVDLETRIKALEDAVSELRARPLANLNRKKRWEKRKLYEAIKPLRETGASWDNVGAAIGVCGERCRQVWQLFVVDVDQQKAQAGSGRGPETT